MNIELTPQQIDLLNTYLDQKDRQADLRQQIDQINHDADRTAGALIESFRGKSLPEIIVFNGRVIEINAAILYNERTHPETAVRLVEKAAVHNMPKKDGSP